jgi:hypothetical protein
MRDLEDEIQHPTGRWTPTVSGVGGGGGGVRVSAVLVSEGCGVLGVVGKTEGLRWVLGFFFCFFWIASFWKGW